jgi:hypothetical protein
MKCKECNEEKDTSEFHFRKDSGKYRTVCKTCWNTRTNQRYHDNKEEYLGKMKKYYQTNRESKIKKQYDYYHSDPERSKEQARKNKAKQIASGYNSMKNRERKLQMKQATPSWADKEEMKYIYKLAKERNLHVDHIVPLHHPEVCGLHTQDNLRCISAEWNLRKNNKHYPDGHQI